MEIIERIRAEVIFAANMLRTLARIIPLARNPKRTLPLFAEEQARKYGDRPLFISRNETLTFRDYNAIANRYARWAMANGVKKGDAVCLMMPNRAMYPAIWLGIARAGGVTALLNTNLTGQALAYSINIVKPAHVIVADACAEAFASAAGLLDRGPTIWRHGGSGDPARRVDLAVAALDDGPIPAAELPELAHNDRCLFIYTSGTTGMPKAANINHYRVMAAMIAFASVMRATDKDRMYDCLPLYHTVGGVVAIGAGIASGGSVYIAEKFSARQFWDDVADQQCTLFQYIGELCRYLAVGPPHPKEGAHRLRVACGNGMRPDVWPIFRKRFRIPIIREFYAATEGNAVMLNLDGKEGAIGRVPRWLRPMFPMINVRLFNEGNEETIFRGPDGFCVPCDPGEVGELISEIVFDPMKPGQRFDGYADRGATDAKIMRDVFKKGDMWFRSADLVRRDRHNYYYFIDRLGDTFRWKGENVSTAEVAETITSAPGVREANVYGVRVPGHEGKAGMVALAVGDGFDLDGLHAHIERVLPPYARPLFLRIQETIDATSTFKQRKFNLVREGFDPAKIGDPLYFDDPRQRRYVRLDAGLHRDLVSGGVRL
jgi:fatty-acyl-CoA synthase